MELREYIDVLYNRKWIVVGTLAIVLAVILIVTFLQAPSYQSKVKILAEVSSTTESVLGNLLSPSLSDTDRFIQNQVKILQTDSLGQAVQRRLEYNYAGIPHMPPPTLIFYHQNVLSGARNPVPPPSRHSTLASSLQASCFPSSGDSRSAFESTLLFYLRLLQAQGRCPRAYPPQAVNSR